MPRLKFLSDDAIPEGSRHFIAHAEAAGSPDPRVLRILFRSKAGEAWYYYWRALTEEGELPADLKELCRVKIAFEHRCGYCGTVRSTRARKLGLTEEKIQEVWDYGNSKILSAREKVALRFADYLKHNLEKADDDIFYTELKEHFTDSEIVELGLWCAENVGAGSFVRTLGIITWEQACELNPLTAENSGGGIQIRAARTG
ncbi:MAG: carboxymuconolactone decarboxylase family protein [Gammaproteobacteria bacterium]|nr:carboxymuconolactone decarboxylase family protein [Gammaproteobacteria bacterium]